jgi:hypothetical protein
MENFREIKNELTWHNDGKFTATLTNGKITELHFCEPGCDANSEGKCLISTDYKYLKDVHDALAELFDFMAKENERMGYKFAGNADVAPEGKTII